MDIPKEVQELIMTAESKALGTWSGTDINVVPVSTIRIVENKIWLINFFFNKTLQNILKHKDVSLSCWKGFVGYQIKGKVMYMTEGSLFEEASVWIKQTLPDRVVKGLLIITPQKIFNLSPSVNEPGKCIISNNKRNMNFTKKEFLLVAVSIVLSVLASSIIQNLVNRETKKEAEEQLIKDYYDTENLVSVSPHGMRLKMDAGEFNSILVDLRSAEEYELGHITGAVNIPAYKDKNTPDYGAVERIVKSFELIPKDKEIITYCYSIVCMTSRKVGKMLAEHGIFVKHLNIGWNEWKNDWQSWNHQHEWFVTWPYQYITAGKEPGEIKVRKDNVENAGCPANGFGC